MCKLVQVAFGFILFDILTGVTAAFYHHELNSRIAREGMYHKLSFSILILFSVFLSYVAPEITEGDIYIPSVEAVCGVIYFIEFQSIIENTCRLMPDNVARKVLQLFHLDSEKFWYLENDEAYRIEND